MENKKCCDKKTHWTENEKHLYTCIARDLENGKIDTIDEIVSLFKRFNKG